jgi:very-short-patch-repair endonuclease
MGGWKFRRQQSIGVYIVDFYCPAARLAIELDGAVHDSEKANTYDDRRSAFLASHGVKVVRFVNDDVVRNIDGVLEVIRTSLPN